MGNQSTKPTLYSIARSGKPDALQVDLAWRQDGDGPLGPDLAQLTTIEVQRKTYLLAANAAGETRAFALSPEAPWITPAESHLDFGGPCQLAPFTIGDRPHILCYSPKSGHFRFHAIGNDLSASKPFEYYRAREPALSTGFSVVQPLTYLGNVYFMGYSIDSGAVDLYSLTVTATAPAEGVPPLQANIVWAWTWAKGWTRFAFFQLGGENFFLKTNILKPNVNIDHLCDDPNRRSNEVGTQMSLADAQELDLVAPFYGAGRWPYFLTYMKSGKTTFNRVHGDCLGWTTEASLDTVAGATRVVTFTTGGRTFALFC